MPVDSLNQLIVSGNKKQLRNFKRNIMNGKILYPDGETIRQGFLSTEKDFVDCKFLTLWDPPKELICNVSSEYPQLTFTLKYTVPQRFIKGKLVIQDNAVLEDAREEFHSVEELVSSVNGDDTPFMLHPQDVGSEMTGRLIPHDEYCQGH